MIETERLVIREYMVADFTAVHEYASQLEVMRFAIYRANSPEDTIDFVGRARASASEIPRRVYERAVVLKNTPDGPLLIGGCSISTEPDTCREGEIGFCFNPRFWRRGYATEAVQAVITFGFRELGLHRIVGRCNAENPASAAVMRKCGMRLEGTFRDKIFAFDRWWNEELYAILEKDQRKK